MWVAMERMAFEVIAWEATAQRWVDWAVEAAEEEGLLPRGERDQGSEEE